MSSSISSIPGIGEVTLEAFKRAGYRTVRDLYAFDLGDVAGDKILMAAQVCGWREEVGVRGWDVC